MQRTHVHQRAESLRARHVEVHQQQIGIRLRIGQGIQRIHRVGLEQLHPRHYALHSPAQGLTEQGMVIGDQQGGH